VIFTAQYCRSGFVNLIWSIFSTPMHVWMRVTWPVKYFAIRTWCEPFLRDEACKDIAIYVLVKNYIGMLSSCHPPFETFRSDSKYAYFGIKYKKYYL